MGRIGINDVKSGMVLAKEVFTFRKQLLLPSGATLTEKNIETMQAWGVCEVEAEGCAELSPADVEASLAKTPALAAAAAALDGRFADVRHDPLMMEILTLAKKQLLGGRA
jgi:hypothetical protein